MLTIRCRCGKQFHVAESSLGGSARCPACQGKLRFVAPDFTPGRDSLNGTLEITQGPHRQGDQLLLGGPGPIEIGKLPDKPIHLPGNKVSRAHCRLIRSASGWRIEDLRSTNGLYVNRQRLDTWELRDGDIIKIGEFELRFLNPQSRPAPAAAIPARQATAATTAAPAVRRSVKVRTAPAQTEPQPAAAPATHVAEEEVPSLLDGGLFDDNLYRLSDGDAVEVEQPKAPTAGGGAAVPPARPQTGGPTCPSCKRSLAPGAKICIQCGINIKTGRALLTSHAADLDTIYTRAESILRWLSWLIPIGIYPIASEAFGTRKPYFIRAIGALTILTSVWFWMYEISDSPRMRTVKNYMLWSGTADPSAEDLFFYYNLTSYGDGEAFQGKLNELSRQKEESASDEVKDKDKDQERDSSKNSGTVKPDKSSDAKPVTQDDEDAEAEQEEEAGTEEEDVEDTELVEYSDDEDEEEDEDGFFFAYGDPDLMLAAHKALPPEKQYAGRYAGYQLITHLFLHGDILHLVGNLLFLFVFGSRVNALLGNISTAILYPLLGIIAAAAHMASTQGEAPCPTVGASGAIMGLAGLYLVLQGMHNMHMAAWFRWGLIRGFRLSLKLFVWRGFWVVLFYIAFDVVATALGSEDNVAHWAHIGGFIGGAAIGLLLLFTRQVNTRGGDIITGLMGQKAWTLIGHPDTERKTLLDRVP